MNKEDWFFREYVKNLDNRAAAQPDWVPPNTLGIPEGPMGEDEEPCHHSLETGELYCKWCGVRAEWIDEDGIAGWPK